VISQQKIYVSINHEHTFVCNYIYVEKIGNIYYLLNKLKYQHLSSFNLI